MEVKIEVTLKDLSHLEGYLLSIIEKIRYGKMNMGLEANKDGCYFFSVEEKGKLLELDNVKP